MDDNCNQIDHIEVIFKIFFILHYDQCYHQRKRYPQQNKIHQRLDSNKLCAHICVGQ